VPPGPNLEPPLGCGDTCLNFQVKIQGFRLCVAMAINLDRGGVNRPPRGWLKL